MGEIYTPEEKEELARRTARTFGCEAVSWWSNAHDPNRLYVEVKRLLSTGEEVIVLIEARFPLPPRE